MNIVGPGGHKMVGYRSETSSRPLIITDEQRRINEMAVLVTNPRTVVLILSFSNPQARIVADGYHFEWFESGQSQVRHTCPKKLTQPLLHDPKRAFNARWVLADTDLVIDEAALFTNTGQQIAGFSFRERFMGLLPPQYHLEWTEGVGLAEVTGHQGLILPPGALG